MKTVRIARRELGAYFFSPVAYPVAMPFLHVESYFFDVRYRVAAAAVAAGELRELGSAAAGLERVFATLTGRAI